MGIPNILPVFPLFGRNVLVSSGMSPPGVLSNLRQQWQQLTSPQEFADGVLEAIATTIDVWLQNHPVLAWLIHHPVISLIGMAVVLLLVWSLFQAIVEITQEFWVRSLKLPLYLGRWMLRGLYRGIRWGIKLVGITLPQLPSMHASSTPVPSTHPSSESPSEQCPRPSEPAIVLNHVPINLESGVVLIAAETHPDADADIVTLLRRLEELSQEQNQILHRLAVLAEAKSQASSSDKVNKYRKDKTLESVKG